MIFIVCPTRWQKFLFDRAYQAHTLYIQKMIKDKHPETETACNAYFIFPGWLWRREQKVSWKCSSGPVVLYSAWLMAEAWKSGGVAVRAPQWSVPHHPVSVYCSDSGVWCEPVIFSGLINSVGVLKLCLDPECLPALCVQCWKRRCLGGRPLLCPWCVMASYEHLCLIARGAELRVWQKQSESVKERARVI